MKTEHAFAKPKPYLLSNPKDDFWNLRPDRFKFYFISTLSILGALLSVLFIFRSVIYLFPKTENLTSLQVDVVDLPDKVKPSLNEVTTPAVENPPVAKEIAPEVPKEEVSAPKEEKITESIPTKPEDLVALENIKKQTIEKEKPLPDPPAPKNINELRKQKLGHLDINKIRQEKLALSEKIATEQKNLAEMKTRELIKGNLKSAGTSLTGTQKLNYDVYYGTLKNHIERFWQLPSWLLKEKNLVLKALIYLDAAGRIAQFEIVHSSGNEEFDRLTEAAVRRSEPLPKPPVNIGDFLSVSGITIEFSP